MPPSEHRESGENVIKADSYLTPASAKALKKRTDKEAAKKKKAKEKDIARTRKPLKLKALGPEIVVIPNIDKDSGWMEKWNGQPLNQIPHSFRLMALGGVGRGKTNSIKNLFLAHQSTDRPFERLYIITCSLGSREYDDLEPTQVFDYVPDMDDLIPDSKYKTLVIIDDYEFVASNRQENANITTLMRFISSHRNTSVVVSYQSFFDTSPILRKCANCFLLYKPTGGAETAAVENRVGLEKGILKRLFKEFCSGTYDSVLVDLTIGSPARLRKNISQKIDIDSDDDEPVAGA